MSTDPETVFTCDGCRDFVSLPTSAETDAISYEREQSGPSDGRVTWRFRGELIHRCVEGAYPHQPWLQVPGPRAEAL